MKPQTQFLIIVVLIIFVLGITWVSFSARNQEPTQTFPATINRDCAPWDGAAFIVTIPMEAGGVVDISIWQSPDIKFPITFSFPDDTGQIGNTSYRSVSSEYEQLSGKVFFSQVNIENSVEGKFDLENKSGKSFKGTFIAEWGNEIIMCG